MEAGLAFLCMERRGGVRMCCIFQGRLAEDIENIVA